MPCKCNLECSMGGFESYTNLSLKPVQSKLVSKPDEITNFISNQVASSINFDIGIIGIKLYFHFASITRP